MSNKDRRHNNDYEKRMKASDRKKSHMPIRNSEALEPLDDVTHQYFDTRKYKELYK